jgi:hypothetical protein
MIDLNEIANKFYPNTWYIDPINREAQRIAFIQGLEIGKKFGKWYNDIGHKLETVDKYFEIFINEYNHDKPRLHD